MCALPQFIAMAAPRTHADTIDVDEEEPSHNLHVVVPGQVLVELGILDIAHHVQVIDPAAGYVRYGACADCGVARLRACVPCMTHTGVMAPTCAASPWWLRSVALFRQ